MDFELLLGDELLVLDGAVLEYFHRGVHESTRIHLRFLSVHAKGPDRHGRMQCHFAPGEDAINGFKVKIPPDRDAEARAFLEAVAAAKRRALGAPPG